MSLLKAGSRKKKAAKVPTSRSSGAALTPGRRPRHLRNLCAKYVFSLYTCFLDYLSAHKSHHPSISPLFALSLVVVLQCLNRLFAWDATVVHLSTCLIRLHCLGGFYLCFMWGERWSAHDTHFQCCFLSATPSPIIASFPWVPWERLFQFSRASLYWAFDYAQKAKKMRCRNI